LLEFTEITSSLLIAVGVVVALCGGVACWIARDIYKDEHSAEYIKGYSDYPDKTMYEKVWSINHTDTNMYRYCKGFEAAALVASKSAERHQKEQFEDYIWDNHGTTDKQLGLR
jgi:hypothetical protein